MQTHTITEFRPEYPRAYLANGLVGLRVGPIPILGGTALISGFVGEQETEIEGFAPTPYPIGADICLDGLWLSQRPDLAVFREQSYDFSNGELRGKFDFRVNQTTAQVEVVTFCSRGMPTIICQEMRVRVDRPAKLILRATTDPKGLPGRCLSRQVPDPGWMVADGAIHWESRGGLGSCGAAYIAEYQGAAAAIKKRGYWGNESAVNTDYTVEARAGEPCVLRQMGSLVPGLLHPEPERQAIRLVQSAQQNGFDLIRRDNAAAWAEIWQGRIKLLGADARWQAVADAAYFYTHTSVHSSTPCSVPGFGLASWQNYFGHVFWDADLFIFPPVLLTAPHAARAMLDFRTRGIQAARNNAALNGYRGLQFPWEVGCNNAEAMPAWACAVFLEQHINLDIAYAFALYGHVTGDQQFQRENAWPVLQGVAEWIVSRVRKTGRGYEIHHLTGVDEGICNIDNNGYMNPASVVVLREAEALARRLGYTPSPQWARIQKEMFIPLDPQGGHILKHDRYKYEGGICNPEPLLAYFPLNYTSSPQEQQATYKYYMGLARTYLGHPVFASLLGVFAARTGDRDLAAELFEGGVADYAVDPFMQFCEYMQKGRGDHAPDPTVYVTNAGSFLMACLMGLPGLQPGAGEPSTWCKFPVTMPRQWEGVEVDRIFVHGRPARLLARHGEQRAQIELG